MQVHPFFPDTVYIFHRLLHPCGRGEQDASACLASDGAQQPLLLVSGFCPLWVGEGRSGSTAGRGSPFPRAALADFALQVWKIQSNLVEICSCFNLCDLGKLQGRSSAPRSLFGAFFNHTGGHIVIAGAPAASLPAPCCLPPFRACPSLRC